MSNFENFTAAETSKMAGLPEQVFVFARAQALEGLETLADTVTLVEIDPARALPAKLVADARIAVIEVDPADPRSLARLDAVRAAQPGLTIIAGLPQVDLSITRMMLRKGIGDVVALPFTVDDLLTAILEVERDQASPTPEALVQLAPMFAVQKCVGGTGATTIATHLADALARARGSACRACVIDLDLQSGDAASYLDKRSRKSLMDLVEAGDRLDDELFRSVAIEGSTAFDIVAAPGDIMPIEELELAALRSVIALARRKYDIVVFDMPAALTNWAMSTLLSADVVVLVANGSLGALRQTKRKLELLHNFDFPKSRTAIVLNNVASGLFKKVDVGGIENALGHVVNALVHSETQLIEQAQAQGVLAMDIQRRSRFAADIDALAAQLLALVEGS